MVAAHPNSSAEPSPPSLADEVRELRRLVDDQATVIADLRRRIDDRDVVPGAGRQGSAPASGTTGPSGSAGPDAATTRRAVMTRGAVAAAGAVIGSATAGALSVSPAAAAQGVFDGDPAVDATSTAGGGKGVLGTSLTTGTGVYGQSVEGTGVYGTRTGSSVGAAVHGELTNADGWGVRGVNHAGSGQAIGVWGVSESTSGRGVQGTSTTSGTGVLGESVDGTGVYGTRTGSGVGAAVTGLLSNPDAFAVQGVNTAGTGNAVGMRGVSASTSGVGVLGIAATATGATVGAVGRTSSPTGTGVRGEATAAGGTGITGDGTTAVRATATQTQLALAGTPAPPLGAGLARVAGELVFDANRDLWLCVQSGTPGTWRRLTGPSVAGGFVPLAAPVRVYDSRPLDLPATGPKSKLVANTPRPVDLTINGTGVPAGATAAMVSLVSVGSVSGGFVSVFKDGIAWPGTSNLNFAAGQATAVTTLTALSTAGRCAVYANVATDIVVDVLGYYL